MNLYDEKWEDYERYLAHVAYENKKHRMSYRLTAWVIGLFFSPFAGLLLHCLGSWNVEIGDYHTSIYLWGWELDLMAWLVGWIICSQLMTRFIYKNNNKKYKTEVIPMLVRGACPGATYSPTGELTKEIIESSKLYDMSWGEKFKCENVVHGQVGQTEFVYCEAEVSNSPILNFGRKTDFKGLIFEADFNKSFQGVTLTSSEKVRMEGVFGLFSEMTRCNIEDVEFEKRFATYTTNDQEARYILTPALQQRIVAMHDTFIKDLGEKKLSISFHDDKLLIMVASDRNRFEMRYDAREIKKDFVALCAMTEIVEMLNLNLRIWSKE